MDRKVPRNRVMTEEKNKFSKINNVIEYISSFTLILLLIVIVVSTFTQVIFRYVFNTPLIWPEEICRLCYVWISFLGMAILVRKGTLLGVDTLMQLVNDRMKVFFFFFSGIVIAVILALLSFLGYEMLSRIEGQSMPATGLSTQWMYIIVPISGVIAIIFLIEIMFNKIQSRMRG